MQEARGEGQSGIILEPTGAREKIDRDGLVTRAMDLGHFFQEATIHLATRALKVTIQFQAMAGQALLGRLCCAYWSSAVIKSLIILT